MDHLTKLQVFQYRLPLKRPLNLGAQTIEHREGLLIRLTTNEGAAGWGEIAPLPDFSRESQEDARRQIAYLRGNLKQITSSDRLIDAITTGHHPQDEASIQATLLPSVRFGLEQALLWLEAAAHEVPVPALLRAQAPSGVLLNSLLIGESVEQLQQAASAAVDQGYQSIKLKVGRTTIDADVKAVRAVSRITAGRAVLRLDANQAWSFEEACTFAEHVPGDSIEYLEEPLARSEQLAAFAAETSMPVALDETARTVTPEALEDYSFASAVIVKPMLMGGFARSAAYVRAARGCGMMPVLSASFESGIGLLGLAWLSAGLDLADIPAGLDTWRWLEEDLLVPPLTTRNGMIHHLDSRPADFSINDRHLSPLP